MSSDQSRGSVPWLQDADVKLYYGDALAVLPSLEAESVDCVVTSPPFWGLRDYGTGAWEGGDAECDHLKPVGGEGVGSLAAVASGKKSPEGARRSQEAQRTPYFDTCSKCGATRIDQQLGLEPTPEQYVERMVEVFREVRRVLAAHGTVWLNLGSSYNVGTNAERKPTTTLGPDVPASWKSRSQSVRRAASGGTPPSQSRRGALAYGSDDRELEGSQELGSSYRDLCDECLADFLSHRDRTTDTPQPPSPDEPQPSLTDRGSEPQDSTSTSPGASPLDAQASTTLQSWRQLRGSCLRCDSRASSLSGVRSSADDAPGFSRNSWLNYTSRLKPKDMVPIPWMVAMALQQDGWFLRADIIWAKPNPMPESVTDRPTKAHEYVFLLSKQPRYFFDQEVVREPAAWERWGDQTNRKHEGSESAAGWIPSRPKSELTGGRQARHYDAEHFKTTDERNTRFQGPNPSDHRRNIRSVWEIATQPFSGRELFGGDGRIPSPDCPVHGDHPVPVPTGRRGGRGDASSPHIQRTDDRPVQESLDGPAPTVQTLSPDSVPASSDSPLLASTATAIPSSTRTRKMSSRSDERDTADAGTLGRTPDSAPSHELPALGDFDSPEKSETPGHTSRTGRPCTCKYIDHFATFPEELARRCIAAGCPEQVCRVCGKARERVVEIERGGPSTLAEREAEGGRQSEYHATGGNLQPLGKAGGSDTRGMPSRITTTVEWTDCGCVVCPVHGPYKPGVQSCDRCERSWRSDFRSGIVLDPFIGSGTVAHVARKLGRHAVGIDLNESYLALAARRLQQQSLFAGAESGL